MRLKNIILEEIKTKGPLPLSRYMELCLYHPEYGYYTQQNPFGAVGDFITSPQISSIFGEVLAVALTSIGQERGYDKHTPVVEFGGGQGELMGDMAGVYEYFGFPHGLHMVEVSERLQKIQQEALKDHAVSWSKDFEGLVEKVGPQPLLMVSNEFLDAFPVDRYVYQEGCWKESCIGADDLENLRWEMQATDFVHPRAYPNPQEGDVFDHPVTALGYMEKILVHLEAHGGVFLAIDYGHRGFQYGDTLQALKGHAFVDTLEGPGEADLTTHVPFDLFEAQARDRGLEVLPLLTQRTFLHHYGFEMRASQVLERTSPEERPGVEQSFHRLTDEEEMGSLFKVMVIVK